MLQAGQDRRVSNQEDLKIDIRLTQKSWIDYSFWPILLTMKYALIFIAVLILLRIDMFIGVLERFTQKIPTFSKNETVESTAPATELKKMDLKVSPKDQLQILLAEFGFNPTADSRQLILDFLKNHQEAIEIDRNALLSEMEKWVPLTQGENIELVRLLADLMSNFKGERFKLVQEFFTLYIAGNPEFFISFYPYLFDPNCTVAKLNWEAGEGLSLESISSRLEIFEALEGKAPPEKLGFLKNCQLVLRVEQSEREKTGNYDSSKQSL